ncbi:MAG: hypothetical protein AAGC97_04290 [Planctomycetota bacterium]
MAIVSPSESSEDAAVAGDQRVDAAPADRPLTRLQEERRQQREKLSTSRFDVVTSFFMSLILFIGTFTLMLFIVWLTLRVPDRVKPFPVIEENPAGRDDNAEGFERDFEPPGAEEVEELMEPTLADTIEAVTDAVSSVAASLDTMNTNATASTAGTGQGDSRPPGPEGEGEDIIPRSERWQLTFSAKGMKQYAQQLDFYKIELGAVGGSIQGVDYANNLSSSPKSRRVTNTDDEDRLYFMWTTPSPLRRFDESLLTQAGVSYSGRVTMKFIPSNLENELAFIELEYAKSKGKNSVTLIAKTIFESKASGGGYKFEVIDQRYRKK